MNEQFNSEQIKAYAKAFCEGDAIWCDNQWWQIRSIDGALMPTSPYAYFIKNLSEEIVIEGFYKEHSQFPYRVTIPNNYDLQGGEKIVCLKEYHTGVTFGKVYDVYILDQTNQPVFRGDDGNVYTVGTNEWGIIPRYEQVAPKEENDMNKQFTEEQVTNYTNDFEEDGLNWDSSHWYERLLNSKQCSSTASQKQIVSQELQEDSTLNILEQKLIELCKEYDELHKDILEKQRYERKLAEVVTNLEETIDSLKRIGDVSITHHLESNDS